MLELDEGQLSRPVLRGRGGSNTSLLPGRSVEAVASGEESAHDLTPLVRREATEQWPVASGQWDGNSGQ